MIYPSVNMLTGQPGKDYTNKSTEKQRTNKPTEKQRTKKPTYIGYVTKYYFVCTDGRAIYNLTNFTIKKAGE